MKTRKNKLVSRFIIGTFVTLYLMVSLISTIHVIEFFRLSNPEWLAISLAVAFEVGAAASLASIIALKKMNKGLVWMLFIVLTLMQAMGNTYYAFTHLSNFSGWVELFDLVEEDLIYQKRVLSLISGAILPLVALGFIKSLVDYIKPEDGEDIDIIEEEDDIEEVKENSEEYVNEIHEMNDNVEKLESLSEEQETNIENIENIIHENENEMDKYKDTNKSVDSVVNVDGGNSGTKRSGRVLSPEHFTVFPSTNANKPGLSSETIKRYPENLE